MSESGSKLLSKITRKGVSLATLRQLVEHSKDYSGDSEVLFFDIAEFPTREQFNNSLPVKRIVVSKAPDEAG